MSPNQSCLTHRERETHTPQKRSEKLALACGRGHRHGHRGGGQGVSLPPGPLAQACCRVKRTEKEVRVQVRTAMHWRPGPEL